MSPGSPPPASGSAPAAGGRPRARNRWLFPVVLVTLLVVAVGGLVVRDLYSRSDTGSPSGVLPSPSGGPDQEQPGSRTVEGTPGAAAHPMYEQVRDLLQRYFDAINERDYDTWRTAVTEQRIRNQPERDWLDSYRSTEDGGMLLHRIETGPAGSARVLMTFTSVQDTVDAPPELPVGCIHWNVVLPLSLEPGGWRVDTGRTSASPRIEEC